MRFRLICSYVAPILFGLICVIGCSSDAERDVTSQLPTMPNEALAPSPTSASGPTCPGCNLLFISIDTLRADRLGYAGHTRPSSPNLDRLAARSIVFEDVMAQAPTTAPSHRSMFSGRYVHEHRNRMKGVPVLAQMLQAEGYATAAFVDGAQLRPAFKLNRGFDRYDSTDSRHVDGAQVGGGFAEIEPKAVEWIGAIKKEPFLLFVHSYDVHCPYTPPEPHRTEFAGGMDPPFEVEGKCGLKYFNDLDIDEAGYEVLSALYDGGVHFADAQVQGLIDALDRGGLAERTVVVVTSDHGEALGERGLVGHNAVYDVHVKVPLLIFIPGADGQRVDAPTQSVDIVPMLAGILGFRTPSNLPGRDWLTEPARLDEPARIRLTQTGDGSSLAVKEGDRFSLIVEAGVVTGLYDLDRDPEQRVDVSAEHEDVKTRLVAWLREHGVTTATIRNRPENLDRRIVDELKALGYSEQ